MSRNPSYLFTAPQGIDVTSSPSSLPQGRWQRTVNFLLDQNGKMRGIGTMTALSLGQGNHAVDGIGYLDTSANAFSYNPGSISGNLCLSVNGAVVQAPLSSISTLPPTFGSLATVTGITLTAGYRTRFLPFDTEMLIAQDGGSNNWYINPTTLAGGTLGTPDPTNAPTVAAGSGALNGTYMYAYTYVDYLGRESDLSPATTFNATGANGPTITIPGMSNTDKYAKAKIYRTIANGTVFLFLAGVIYSANSYPNDSVADASLGAQAPNPGENAPPLPGNVFCEHKQRVWMNVNAQPNILQYSNEGSATQWSTLPIPATDGNKINVQSSNSDYIVGLVSFASALMVFRKKSILGVFGQDNTNFQILPLQSGRGAFATDTIVRCENVIIFLAADGVYALDTSFNLTKISKTQADGGIEADIISDYLSSASRLNMANAVAWYVDRTYYITIGTKTYAFDLDRAAWREHAYSNFSTTYINCATVLQISQMPNMAAVGVAGSPYGAFILDNYNTGQTITNLSATTPAIPDRSHVRTVLNVRIWGTGTVNSGTLTCYYDDNSTAVTLNTTYLNTPLEGAQGAIIYQEFLPNATGRVIYFTLALSGTGLVLSDWLVEFMDEG